MRILNIALVLLSLGDLSRAQAISTSDEDVLVARDADGFPIPIDDSDDGDED